jgi:glucose-1-phosphate thymidylyltransferase
MKSLILASGFGSRLYPVTRITPKSLIDVKKKPMLEHIIENLDNSKYINQIYIVYADKFSSQFYEFVNSFSHDKQIELINDKHKTIDEMPGSIGTIAYFVKLKDIKDDLIVLAGDSLFDFNIDDFIEFYNKHNKKTSVAVYDIKDKNKANRFGVVELKGNRIINFEEKPENPKTSLISTLCYILSNKNLHHLERKTFKENAGELIKHLVENDEEVYGFKFEEKFFDIGTHEDLEKARKEF